MGGTDGLAGMKRMAADLLRAFRPDYVFGLGVFPHLGKITAGLGRRAVVVASGVGKPWGAELHAATRRSLAAAGVEVAGKIIRGAAPNSPREDVARVAAAIREREPEVVCAVGGGSVIDACKASLCLLALGDIFPDLDTYFGVNRVTNMLRESGRKLVPLVAAQIAAGSGAHLTRYSNITDMRTHQKLLIIDEAVTPPRALFDYARTRSMGRDFTLDGAMDGLAHCLEVYLGAGEELLPAVEPRCLPGIELIVGNMEAAVTDPGDLAAREALGLGTDLGGNAIMLGGTNGAHLNSFSLVDLLPHGRACALMNPYYVVFFAPAVEERLRRVGAVYARAGHTRADLQRLAGRDLGLAVAEAMLAHARDLGFPTRLRDVPGYTPAHARRALVAAKDPRLASKLRNMPVPLVPEQVDEYMGSVLAAAENGDPELVKKV